MYKKRMGTSGMSGHLFEIKLISLLYFRAFHKNTIEDFQLGSNVDDIGAFDDVCIRAKVEGFDKPISVFIQARHRENKKRILTIDLSPYFVSYLKIRQNFSPSNEDLFFKGTFDETECLFVIYTTERDEFSNDYKIESSIFSVLNDLIDTGGTARQLDKQQENIKALCDVAMKEQMTSLAESIAKLVNDDRNYQTMLNNKIVLQFHVILAREVFDVSEIQPAGHRVATFRSDFFDKNEKYLSIFRNTLFKFSTILRKSKIESTDVKSLLSQLLADPTDARTLSKVIGTVVTYNNGFLEIDKKYRECFRPELEVEKVYVSQLTVNQAVELAVREIISSLQFKVPASFGNKDLTIRGSDDKKEKRVTYLAFNIASIISHNCEPSKIVTIDESLESGFLQLNGGITGAIGNLFVLDDDNSKLMKITDNSEQLGPVAKMLYSKLNSQIHNLHEYKFCFKLNECPKFSFEYSDHEENLAKDFLNRLLIYSDQANVYEVEEILKQEIKDLQNDQADYFQVQDDVIFLRYFDLVQKWWSQQIEAPYLTRNMNLFQQPVKYIIKDPLMSSINLICKSKIKKYGYKFNEDVVRSLNLLDQYMSTVIIADNSVLSVAKVIQHLKNKHHVVLDFEYIADLPADERNSLCKELMNRNENKILILICDETDSINDITSLEIIGDAVRFKKTIVVTNQTTFKTLQKYFPKADKILHDKKLRLMDLSEASQKSIVETATATFPGVEIRLEQLLKGCPEPGSK